MKYAVEIHGAELFTGKVKSTTECDAWFTVDLILMGLVDAVRNDPNELLGEFSVKVWADEGKHCEPCWELIQNYYNTTELCKIDP